jgi:HEAT repeat protein
VPKLIKLLKDEDQWVRKSAAKALGMLRATEAVPALRKAASDSSDQVQRNVERSLKQIEEG